MRRAKTFIHWLSILCCTVYLDPFLVADEFEVPLTVQESVGVNRALEPISGGIPLPRGKFTGSQRFALFRGDGDDGAELPCQVSPLVTETDGTRRWILLDFQDRLDAGASQRYLLRAVAPTTRPASSLKIADGATGVTVDTGAMVFTVSRKAPFGIFEAVKVAGKSMVTGGEVSYVQLAGRKGWNDPSGWRRQKLSAAVPDTVRLHHVGPLRVTIEVGGRFEEDPLAASYRAWITTWAGSSRVRVKYKLCNSNSNQYTAIPVESSSIVLRLGYRPQGVLLGAVRPLSFEGDAWMHQGLFMHHTYQDVAGSARAGSGKEIAWTASSPADRPRGWIATTGPQRLFVCDRLFSSNPARRLEKREQALILQGIARRFEGPPDRKFNEKRRIGEPWRAEGFWLYDCSHHTSEYLIDFAPPASPEDLDRLATASGNALLAMAPGDYYSDCEVLGTGRFATLEEEIASYRKWSWKFTDRQVPDHRRPLPDAFVPREDNHYESEADSVQGLLLMYLRTGQRGWFDLAEAWARYHMDLQTWRTDGWAWKDGGIWFPSGGPQGNRQVRKKWNFEWGADWGNRKGSADCTDLWVHARSKSCYCHYYGSGLADYFCLTGDPDALEAAIDNVEQKDDEFNHFRKLTPGESTIGSIRGFGRGFEVMMRVLMAAPDNREIRDLCVLSARTLMQSPLLDERGFHCSKIGGGWSGMPVKHLTPAILEWMKEQGIRYTTEGDTVDTLTRGGRSWKVRCVGGTWQHIYVQNGADLYARYFDDEDMRDFVIAFAQMSACFMLSPKCHQTWYYTYFDVPELGAVFDPWAFDHTDTTDGEGCVHSGWYTRFYPDVCARGYSLTGEKHLLERGREFWHYGSRRSYRSKNLRNPAEVAMFVGHTPPKDDTVLEVTRLLLETARPRRDTRPPTPISDLEVALLEKGVAEIRFTAPADVGGGAVARYQVKVADLPMVPYESWEFARDHGTRRNWWRATNCGEEPRPGAPGKKERFVVNNVPAGEEFYFAIRSFDDSNNRSAMSNQVTVKKSRKAAHDRN